METALWIIVLLLTLLVVAVVGGVALLGYGLYLSRNEQRDIESDELPLARKRYDNTMTDLVVNMIFAAQKIKWLKKQDCFDTDLQEVDDVINAHHFKMERQMMWIEFKATCKLRYKNVDPRRVYFKIKKTLKNHAE